MGSFLKPPKSNEEEHGWRIDTKNVMILSTTTLWQDYGVRNQGSILLLHLEEEADVSSRGCKVCRQHVQVHPNLNEVIEARGAPEFRAVLYTSIDRNM